PAQSPFHRSAVVADLPDGERIVQLSDLLESVQHASDLMVGLRGVGSKDFHQARRHAPLIWRKGIPGRDLLGPRRELRARRDDAELELPLIGFFAILVPALIELALEPVDPFLR